MRDISASVSFPRQFIVRIAFVFLLLLAVGIFSPSGVRADNFAVSTPAELSAAINNANNEGTYPGLDVITLTAAAFTVSAADNASSVAGDNNAFPVITSDITITYAGPGRATIERSGGTPMRFFEVAPGGYFTLENIVLDNGLAQWGGAIYNRGTTGLTNAILQDNHAAGQRGKGRTNGQPGPGGGRAQWPGQCAARPALANRSASLHQIDYEYHQRQDQQHVHEAAHRIGGGQAKRPKHKQNYHKGPQHVLTFLLFSRDLPLSGVIMAALPADAFIRYSHCKSLFQAERPQSFSGYFDVLAACQNLRPGSCSSPRRRSDRSALPSAGDRANQQKDENSDQIHFCLPQI